MKNQIKFPTSMLININHYSPPRTDSLNMQNNTYEFYYSIICGESSLLHQVRSTWTRDTHWETNVRRWLRNCSVTVKGCVSFALRAFRKIGGNWSHLAWPVVQRRREGFRLKPQAWGINGLEMGSLALANINNASTIFLLRHSISLAPQ